MVDIGCDAIYYRDSRLPLQVTLQLHGVYEDKEMRNSMALGFSTAVFFCLTKKMNKIRTCISSGNVFIKQSIL